MYYIFFYVFCILMIYYKINKGKLIYQNNAMMIINNGKKKSIKILTYNIKSMPHILSRNYEKIKDLILKYDVLCLQENFSTLLGTNKKCYGYNCIIPEGSYGKMIDSGLSVYSKYNIEYIDFIRFDNLASIDKLSDKGFIIFKIDDLYIINLHLQAIYSKDDDNKKITKKQLDQVINYCNNLNKVLICGDFNICLSNLNIPGYNKIISNIPTHWSILDGIMDTSSKYKKNDNFIPFYLDGGFYKNIKVKNIQIQDEIDNTDHLGVSFEIIL